MATRKNRIALFTKEQLIHSTKYKHKIDMLNALLDPANTYTHEEVDAIISKHLKGKVK